MVAEPSNINFAIGSSLASATGANRSLSFGKIMSTEPFLKRNYHLNLLIWRISALQEQQNHHWLKLLLGYAIQNQPQENSIQCLNGQARVGIIFVFVMRTIQNALSAEKLKNIGCIPSIKNNKNLEASIYTLEASSMLSFIFSMLVFGTRSFLI